MSEAMDKTANETTIIAGVGFTSGATADEIALAVRAALTAHGLGTEDLGLIAAIGQKRGSAALRQAAEKLGAPLTFVAGPQLAEASPQTLTRSAISARHSGLPSASEAAALGAGGAQATLVAARHVEGPVTCALVRAGPGAGAPGTEAAP